MSPSGSWMSNEKLDWIHQWIKCVISFTYTHTHRHIRVSLQSPVWALQLSRGSFVARDACLCWHFVFRCFLQFDLFYRRGEGQVLHPLDNVTICKMLIILIPIVFSSSCKECQLFTQTLRCGVLCTAHTASGRPRALRVVDHSPITYFWAATEKFLVWAVAKCRIKKLRL